MSKPLSRKAKIRLTKLAAYMARIRDTHFHMDHFFGHEGDTFVDAHGGQIGDVLTPRDLHSCGTSACALGHACFAPGLRYVGLRYRIAYNALDRRADPFMYYKGRRLRDYFKGAQEAFDLDKRQVEHLFGGHGHVIHTPRDWANHCRAFLAADGDLSQLEVL